MEEQMYMIVIAGAVSSFFISSIKGHLSKKGKDHTLTQDQVTLIVAGVSLLCALTLAVVKENFNFQAIFADYAGILGAAYLVYQGVMKRKIKGKTIDNYIEEN